MNSIHKEKNNHSKKPTTEFIVDERTVLLDFLLRKFSHRPRSYAKSLLTHRAVSIDGKTTTQYNLELSKGQTIRINLHGHQPSNQKGFPEIIYEDDDFIVINKPHGLLSIATEKEKKQTAYHMLTDYVRIANPKGRIFIVHRLDRETSGIFMVAKNERMKLALQNSWSDLVSERGYYAIVEGHFAEKNGRIESWLKETKTMFVYSSSQADDGLKAITNYQVVSETKDHSLLKILLETGRKNQIRVHMKDLGHPVAGDKKYGAKTTPLHRLCLHANKLTFRHPISQKIMSFETELPKNFQSMFHTFQPV